MSNYPASTTLKARATETDPQRMTDAQLTAFIKYQYHRTAHAYEQLDYAIRLLQRGETPDYPIRSYRKSWSVQMDLLQAAFQEKEKREVSMR